VSNRVLFSYGYFKYKYRTFKPETIVKFNEDWLVAHGYSLYVEKDAFGRECRYGPLVYGQFEAGYPNKICYFSRGEMPESFNNAEWHMIPTDTFPNGVPEEAIEEVIGFDEIVHWAEICNNNVQNGYYGKARKSWNQVPEVKMLLVVYIVLMIASLIFTQPWGAWLVLTIAFLVISNALIDDAS
jgi:hypothetical protein